MTIRLEPIPRRAWLTSFGLVVSSLSLLVSSALAWHQESTSVFAMGAGMAIGLALLAGLRPEIWRMPYRAWNKLARHYAEFARIYILGLCYLIISSAGLAGPSPEFSRTAPAGSGWIPWRSRAVSGGGNRHHGKQEEMFNRSWIRAYASWAMGSRQYWAIGLLPFLMCLSTLDIEEGSQTPTRTYTLF